jgi:hypothetical protein
MTLHNPWALFIAIPLALVAAWVGVQRWRQVQDVAHAPAEVVKVVAHRDVCGRYGALRDDRRDCTRFTAHARFSVDGRNHLLTYDAGVVDGRNVSPSHARVKVGQRVPAAYRRSDPDDAWVGNVEATWGEAIGWAALALFGIALAVLPRAPAFVERFERRMIEIGDARRAAELERRAEAERERAAADQRRFEQD